MAASAATLVVMQTGLIAAGLPVIEETSLIAGFAANTGQTATTGGASVRRRSLARSRNGATEVPSSTSWATPRSRSAKSRSSAATAT